MQAALKHKKATLKWAGQEDGTNLSFLLSSESRLITSHLLKGCVKESSRVVNQPLRNTGVSSGGRKRSLLRRTELCH